jgi:hypothetical protein
MLLTPLLKITHCHCLHYCVGNVIMPARSNSSSRHTPSVMYPAVEVRSLTEWRKTPGRPGGVYPTIKPNFMKILFWKWTYRTFHRYLFPFHPNHLRRCRHFLLSLSEQFWTRIPPLLSAPEKNFRNQWWVIDQIWGVENASGIHFEFSRRQVWYWY